MIELADQHRYRRWYLELRSPDRLRPAPCPSIDFSTLTSTVSPDEYLALYRAVGHDWGWRDRLEWTRDRLAAYLAAPDVHLWVARSHAKTVGYFELQALPDDSVELMYFGLMPDYVGKGLGGWLLTRAVQEALGLGADRVRVNTCTLDSPHALPNYIARGFVVVREERFAYPESGD